MPRPGYYHVLFWLLFAALAVTYDTLVKHQGIVRWCYVAAELSQPDTWVQLGRILVTVYGSLWVFSRFPFQGQPVLVLGEIVVLGILDAALTWSLERYVVLPLNRTADVGPITDVTAKLPFSWLFVMMAFVFRQWRDQFRNGMLLHEKNTMELAYLKAQLNPHFLFNTLNNLYGLALTEPESTPEVILKLAELMRYMLHEGMADQVSLEQEVEYLNSYIALEKLRYEETVYVDFAVDGTLADLHIAPLLFICLVENAFKHGNLHDPARPMRFRLSVHDRQVRFTAHNQTGTGNQTQPGGVGLPTLRRRLALLYPQRHQLTVDATADGFGCTLELDIRPNP